jgi:chloramphenicol-sensitive protein RarD
MSFYNIFAPDMRQKKYYSAALGAFIIWGFFSLALKPLHNYSSLDILFYRVFIAAILMCAVSLLFRRKLLADSLNLYNSLPAKDKRKSVLLTFLGGLLLTANWLFFIYSMNHISIKAASYAYLICPILTTLLAFFILGEKLTRLQWASVMLSVVSCSVLAYNALHELFFSMVVALSYAFYLISQRQNNLFDKFLILTFQMIFAGLILLPFYPVYAAEPPTDPNFYLMILLIAIVFTLIPLFLNLYALKGVNSSTMGILLYINPLLNFTIAILYFNEVTNRVQVLAYLLILISILLFNFQNIKKIKQT